LQGMEPRAEYGQGKELWLRSKEALLASVHARKEGNTQKTIKLKNCNRQVNVQHRPLRLIQRNDCWNPRITGFVQDPATSRMSRFAINVHVLITAFSALMFSLHSSGGIWLRMLAVYRPEVAVRLLSAAMPTRLATQTALSVCKLASLNHPWHKHGEEQSPVIESAADQAESSRSRVADVLNGKCGTDPMPHPDKTDTAVNAGHGPEYTIRRNRPSTMHERPCVGQHMARFSTSCAYHRTRTQYRKLSSPGKTSVRLHPEAQRPVTVMNASTADMFPWQQHAIAESMQKGINDLSNISADEQTMLKNVRDEEIAADHEADMLKSLLAKVSTEQPLSVKVANTDQQKQIQFHFHSQLFPTPGRHEKTLIITEHHDGAKYCEDLFGHFVLPNGKLAHFYYRVCSCPVNLNISIAPAVAKVDQHKVIDLQAFMCFNLRYGCRQQVISKDIVCIHSSPPPPPIHGKDQCSRDSQPCLSCVTPHLCAQPCTVYAKHMHGRHTCNCQHRPQ